MINIPSKEHSKTVLTEYYNEKALYIKKNVEIEKQKELLRQLYVKLLHSFNVAEYGITIMEGLEFNPSTIELSYHPYLKHDIGRFLQIALIKDMEDYKIKTRFPNIRDHGELGRMILKDDGYICKFFQNTRLYDNFVCNVVGYHVPEQEYIPKSFRMPIDMNNKSFFQKDLKQIFDNELDILRLTSYCIKIVKDADRIDIYRQIMHGDLLPLMSPDKKDGSIHPETFDMFFKGEYLDIQEISRQGKWTKNTGQLVWWSFLYHTTFVSTIKIIKEKNMLEKMWDKTRAHEIDELTEAYEFAKYLLNALINTSEDGVLTNVNQAIDVARKEIGVKRLIRKPL